MVDSVLRSQSTFGTLGLLCWRTVQDTTALALLPDKANEGLTCTPRSLDSLASPTRALTLTSQPHWIAVLELVLGSLTRLLALEWAW